MSWVDGAIIVFILLGVWQGFFQGFLLLLFHVVSLVLAVLVTFWALPRASGWMEQQIKIPVSYGQPLALALVFLATSTLFGFIGNVLHKLFAPIIKASIINRVLGMVLGGLRQVLLAGVILTLLVSLPVSATVKSTLNESKLARPLIQMTLKVEQFFEARFNTDALNSVVYRTVGKDQSTTTALNYTVEDPKLDLVGETTMTQLTNEVRKKQGVAELKHNDALREVARAHARDMLAKGYFSHLSPQGEDVGKRVQKANITATIVGENLANAPTILMAQAGLLASEGHRNNIISPDFNQIGIGVLDAGIHGKMVVQVFAFIP